MAFSPGIFFPNPFHLFHFRSLVKAITFISCNFRIIALSLIALFMKVLPNCVLTPTELFLILPMTSHSPCLNFGYFPTPEYQLSNLLNLKKNPHHLSKHLLQFLNEFLLKFSPKCLEIFYSIYQYLSLPVKRILIT